MGSAAPRAAVPPSGQAEVLRRIAAQGRAAFYEGEVAEDMVASLQAIGGVHTLEDFANTRSDYTEPVSGHYKGVELVEHPPNGQGATAILLATTSSRSSTSRRWTRGARFAPISRPRRPSSPMPRGTASSPTPIT
jgi:gamma-glutamyltranspeptidase